jgi:succinate dehydrogenase hydrophobic anchor subunit
MLIQVTGILTTILVVYLISTRLISKNNKDIVYEDEMDEIELKSIDDELDSQ